MDFLLPHYLNEDDAETSKGVLKSANDPAQAQPEQQQTQGPPAQNTFSLPSFMASSADTTFSSSSITPVPVQSTKKTDVSVSASASTNSATKSKDGLKLANNVYCFDKEIAAKVESNSDYLYSRAVNYRKQDKMSEAVAAFEEYISMNIIKLANGGGLSKEHSHPHTELHETVYQSYVHLGLLFAYSVSTESLGGLEGKLEKVRSCFDSASVICPKRAEPLFYFAIFCNRNGQQRMAVQYLLNAEKLIYEESVALYPDVQATAYGKYLGQELGQAYAALGDAAGLADVVEKISKDDEMIQLVGFGVFEEWQRAVQHMSKTGTGTKTGTMEVIDMKKEQ